MNITFVFDGLQIGGVEKVGVEYANLFAEHGHKVTLVNLAPGKKEMYEVISPAIKIIECKLPREIIPQRYLKGKEKGIVGVLSYLCISFFLNIYCMGKKIYVRKKKKRDDVIVAFSGHFNDLFFVSKEFIKTTKKVAWLHGAEYEYKELSPGYFALYRDIKNLVCLSDLNDDLCSDFNEKNSINKVKIYNPIRARKETVNSSKVKELNEEYGEYVLTVGRLSPDKDQKTIIKAISSINEGKSVPIHLLLVGDGSTRRELEEYVVNLHAGNYIHFMGKRMDVQNYYAGASVFAHSSPKEGLPTVLLEAMAYGVPIAATDSVPGVREILGDNCYGLISPVGDWKQLSDNIVKLLDKDERLRFIENGSERIKDFAPEWIYQQACDYIEGIIR